MKLVMNKLLTSHSGTKNSTKPNFLQTDVDLTFGIWNSVRPKHHRSRLFHRGADEFIINYCD